MNFRNFFRRIFGSGDEKYTEFRKKIFQNPKLEKFIQESDDEDLIQLFEYFKNNGSKTLEVDLTDTDLTVEDKFLAESIKREQLHFRKDVIHTKRQFVKRISQIIRYGGIYVLILIGISIPVGGKLYQMHTNQVKNVVNQYQHKIDDLTEDVKNLRETLLKLKEPSDDRSWFVAYIDNLVNFVTRNENVSVLATLFAVWKMNAIFSGTSHQLVNIVSWFGNLFPQTSTSEQAAETQTGNNLTQPNNVDINDLVETTSYQEAQESYQEQELQYKMDMLEELDTYIVSNEEVQDQLKTFSVIYTPIISKPGDSEKTNFRSRFRSLIQKIDAFYEKKRNLERDSNLDSDFDSDNLELKELLARQKERTQAKNEESNTDQNDPISKNQNQTPKRYAIRTQNLLGKQTLDLNLDDYKSAEDAKIPSIRPARPSAFEMTPGGLSVGRQQEFVEIDEEGNQTPITDQEMNDIIKDNQIKKDPSEAKNSDDDFVSKLIDDYDLLCENPTKHKIQYQPKSYIVRSGSGDCYRISKNKQE